MYRPLAFKSECPLSVGRLRHVVRGRFDAAPTRDEIVVGTCVFSPALTLAEGVKSVSELTRCFSPAFYCSEDAAGTRFPFLFEGADKVVQCFPDRVAGVGLRIPACGVFRPSAEPHDAAAGFHRTGLLHAIHAGALGAGESVGIAEAALAPAVLLEPMQTKLGVWIEVILGKEAIDELKGSVNAHRRAVGFQYGGVFGKDRHTGAEDGL